MKAGVLVGIACALAATDAARAQTCEVEGTVADLRVRIDGSSVDLLLDGLAVRVIPASAGSAQVIGDVPLEFVGRARGVRYHPKETLVALGGTLRLSHASEIRVVRVDGSHVTVDAELAPGVEARGLVLDCSDLAVDALPPISAAPLPPVCEGDPYRMRPNAAVRSEPEGEPAFRVAGRPFVREIERRGRWQRVAFCDGDTGSIDGWVEARELTRVHGDFATTGGRSRPDRPRQGHGFGLTRWVDAGTTVHAGQNGRQIATVTRLVEARIGVALPATIWPPLYGLPNIRFLSGGARIRP
jgi:hypothetical protein